MNPNLHPNHIFYHGFTNVIPAGMNLVPTGVFKMSHGRRQLFSYEEDEQLKKLVEQFGDKDWKLIARKMPGRSTRQCRERYKNYLSPDIKNGPWTKEEDDLLKEKYNEYGPHWSSISKFFKSRSDVNIKNRWSALSFHMNNDSNCNKNTFSFYPYPAHKKSKIVYPPAQNFCFQEHNYNYGRGNVTMMPATAYQSNINQTINYHQQVQSHLVSTPSPTNINSNIIEKSNSEDDAQNDDDDSNNDEILSPPTIQPSKQQNSEIENIVNESRAINATPNSDNSIPISSNPMPGSIIVVPSPVPMSVDFSGPLPPLLQKPKLQQHGQQSTLLNSNYILESNELHDQKRSINSPISANQINPNSPLPIDDKSSLSSLITQQDEQKNQRQTTQIKIDIQLTEKDDEKKNSMQQPKDDIFYANNNNSSIPISQILTPINTINITPQISSVQNLNSNSVSSSAASNTSLTIHKPQNQQHNQIKQTALPATTNPDYPLNSSFLVNFPFPQSLLASNDQQESILASDARIDDASINTETEVLTNTFPNFGGRLW